MKNGVSLLALPAGPDLGLKFSGNEDWKRETNEWLVQRPGVSLPNMSTLCTAM